MSPATIVHKIQLKLATKVFLVTPFNEIIVTIVDKRTIIIDETIGFIPLIINGINIKKIQIIVNTSENKDFAPFDFPKNRTTNININRSM